MKRTCSKLILHRETLRRLTDPELCAAAAGNFTAVRTCETACGLPCPQPPPTKYC
jgi:hypothetical protein